MCARRLALHEFIIAELQDESIAPWTSAHAASGAAATRNVEDRAFVAARDGYTARGT